MNLFTPGEFTENYISSGCRKCSLPPLKMFLLAILAGALIAFGGAMSSTAVHAISNESLARIISGLLFPCGLIMVLLTGAELFTGNCLIAISVASGKAGLWAMLRNLGIVYLGNFAGALLVASICAFFGQMDLSEGGLGAYAIRIAAAKSAIPFGNGLVLGIACNFLVCTAVMLALSAKDLVGRAVGAFAPICVFVVCGFEHCVANMYYIPAGLFALGNPEYAARALETGWDMSGLTIGGFLLGNLLPVSIGNIIGGLLFALMVWYCHGKRREMSPAG